MSSRAPRGTSIPLIAYLDEKFRGIESSVEEIRSQGKEHAGQIDEIKQSVSQVNVTLAKQSEQLRYHIKRTDILERDMRPMKSFWDGTLKIGGFVLFLVTVLTGLLQLVQWYMAR